MKRDRAEQKIKDLVGRYIEIGKVEYRFHSDTKKIAKKKCLKKLDYLFLLIKFNFIV